MRAYKWIGGLCLALIWPTVILHADEIDLTVELNKVLFSETNKVPIYHLEMPNAFCRSDGSLEGAHPIVAAAVRCGFRFTNVRAVSVDVSYSSPKAAAIPTTLVKDVWQYQNCSSLPLPITDNISLSSQEGSSVTTSTSVTTGSNTTTTAGVTVPIYAVQFSYSANVQYSFSKTDTTQQASSLTETRSTVQNINVTVPPLSVYAVTLQKEVSNAYIDYDGIVTLDADVLMHPMRGPAAKQDPQGPDISLGKLSQVASTAARTVHLKGQIWNAKGHSVVRNDKVTPIEDMNAVCPKAGGTKPLVKQTDIQKRDAFFAATSMNSGALSRLVASAMQTTQPLTNGMTITTSNSVANVEVRAKSFGPGFCAVGISSPYGQSNFLAPPLTWSPWTHLFSHMGAITATLGTSVGCSTGAVFEVRYFK